MDANHARRDMHVKTPVSFALDDAGACGKAAVRHGWRFALLACTSIGLTVVLGLLAIVCSQGVVNRFDLESTAIAAGAGALLLTMVGVLVAVIGCLIVRRRPQFALRSLLLVVTLVAVSCSCLFTGIRCKAREMETARAIEKHGANVTRVWSWLGELTHDDRLMQVLAVQWPLATDADLAQLQDLPHLLVLNLDYSSVTDAGLADVARLNGLMELRLCYTQVTKAGLNELRGMKTLDGLILRGTKITEEEVDSFRSAVPECDVCYPD